MIKNNKWPPMVKLKIKFKSFAPIPLTSVKVEIIKTITKTIPVTEYIGTTIFLSLDKNSITKNIKAAGSTKFINTLDDFSAYACTSRRKLFIS